MDYGTIPLLSINRLHHMQAIGQVEQREIELYEEKWNSTNEETKVDSVFLLIRSSFLDGLNKIFLQLISDNYATVLELRDH